MLTSYFKDLRAVEAKFEAQKIAFSPLCFWAINAMLANGLLRLVESYGEEGVCRGELAQKGGFDEYSVNLLTEIGLGMGVFRLAGENENFGAKRGENSNLKAQNSHYFEPSKAGEKFASQSVNLKMDSSPCIRKAQNDEMGVNLAQNLQNSATQNLNSQKTSENATPNSNLNAQNFTPNFEQNFPLKLGKIGWFLLHDELTRVNFNFVRDICYEGAKELESSLKTRSPQGLRHFSTQWATIYEGLSRLPEPAKTSWFEFDHYYSDCAFPAVLPLVFAKKPRLIYDIGGNTAKFAIAACAFDEGVRVRILDLPSQTRLAQENIAKAGLQERINTADTDILNQNSALNGEPDAVWLSQFLDCFSLEQITFILGKIREISRENTQIFVLEPLWDAQRYEAAAFSLQATSLYFTTMANGKSKMYGFAELRDAVCAAGFRLANAHHNLGANCYSLLEFARA